MTLPRHDIQKACVLKNLTLNLELLFSTDKQFCTNSRVASIFGNARQERAGDILIHLSLSVSQLSRSGCSDWRYWWMVPSIYAFSWLLVTIFEKISRIFTVLVMFLERGEHLFEVEVVRECRGLSSRICRETSKVETLSNLEGLACATAEALGTGLQQLDCVETLRSCLGHRCLMYGEHLRLSGSVVHLESLVNG